MKMVIIASTNPVKINATKNAFEAMFPGIEFSFEGLDSPSQVSAQPMGTEETVLGARNRIKHIREARPEADYFVGLEGGLITDENNHFVSQAWMVVVDKTGKESKAATATFVLPEVMSEMIRSGLEMGHATDRLYGLVNSKQKSSSVGVLTDNTIDRTAYYTHALTLALIPFKNAELY
ncbi:MAG: inosine/xanthosine triphosphatase [Patescibacteria group bacterium]|nr:inosine/xanthosine triphosphatase [Patescibacteria group bacterium]